MGAKQNQELQHTRKSEQRVWFCGHADADQGVFRFVEDLRFPVVNLVLFGHRQVALDTALSIEELDLSATFDKAVCDFQFRLKLPSLYTLLLNCKELRQGYVGLDRLRRISCDEGFETQSQQWFFVGR